MIEPTEKLENVARFLSQRLDPKSYYDGLDDDALHELEKKQLVEYIHILKNEIIHLNANLRKPAELSK